MTTRGRELLQRLAAKRAMVKVESLDKLLSDPHIEDDVLGADEQDEDITLIDADLRIREVF